MPKAIYNDYRPPKRYSKKSPYWYTNFTVNSQCIRESCRTDDYKKAKAFSLALYAELTGAAEKPKGKPVMTISEVFAEYWKKEGSYKVTGWDSILTRIRRFEGFFTNGYYKGSKFIKGQGLQYWHEIEDKHVSDFVHDRRSDKVQITKNFKSGKVLVDSDRTIKHSSINKELTTLGRVQNFADDILKIEPASFKIKRHKLNEEDVVTRALTPLEQDMILENMPDYWADAVEFCFETGFRAKHLFPRKRYTYKPLRRRDINIDTWEATIWSKSSNVEGGKIHTKAITPRAMEILKKCGLMKMAPDDIIFVYPEGHKFEGQPLGDYRKALYKAFDLSGLDRSHGEGIHLTRRSFATNLLRGGLSLSDVQDELFHTSPKTTKKYLKVDSKTKANKTAQALKNAKNMWSDKDG